MSDVINMNRQFLEEKLFSFGIAMFFIFLLTPHGVADIYLILGHAHFALAYLYMGRAGDINPKKAMQSILLIVAIFVVGHSFPAAFTVFVAGFLVFHVYVSEIKILDRTHNFPCFSIIVCLATIMCVWLGAELWNFTINLSVLWGLIITILGLSSVFIIYNDDLRKNIKIDPLFSILIGLLLSLFMMDLTGNRPMSYETFGFVSIAHYMTMYFIVAKKFYKSDKDKFIGFFKESLMLNAFFLMGYIIFFSLSWQNTLGYQAIYHPISFYAWALAHFITTFKMQDYKRSFVM